MELVSQGGQLMPPGYGKPPGGGTRRRSNRQVVEWIPCIQATYGHAIVAAEAVGIDLALWVDDAIQLHLERTREEVREARYREACDIAAERMEPTPLRPRRSPPKPQPFVRSAPEASGEDQAGRPSSRHDQNGTESQAWSYGAGGRSGATRSRRSAATRGAWRAPTR
jgi:hypothetical protein